MAQLALVPPTQAAAPRGLPDEVPVAITCNGSSQAVMMASPHDIEDFAWGFTWTEGIVSGRAEVEQFDTVDHGANGIEARFWLTSDRAEALAARRRERVGPVGCGLCGIESLEEATRPLPRVDAGGAIPASDIARATDMLRTAQSRSAHCRGLHAAGFLQPGRGVGTVREDVGRHNALDKVCGAVLRAGKDAAAGAIVLSSRVSIDLVQKTATAGCPILVAVSTPTRAAVAAAEAADLTLVALARGGAFEVFTHPRRIV
ncbi:formate dehydrogenase accessory sulfurtransferase FdhD [Palleronia sp.]|uniref:formate dehydrogenase accessory sulfurtransferase FdhD n=1 Tax=Palleronia sp. TaxID=1940284 RepID=UPI0035C7A347